MGVVGGGSRRGSCRRDIGGVDKRFRCSAVGG